MKLIVDVLPMKKLNLRPGHTPFAGERKTILARIRSGSRVVELGPVVAEFLQIPENTFFVRAGGSDANDGRTPLEPWGSLAHALENVGPGATVHVGAGIHPGPFTLAVDSSAGIPLVLGSDSGIWPIVPYELHGVTTLREIERLAQSGLTQAEALAAATQMPARMLALGTEIGTIEPGKRADLVIVRGDPLLDLRALRRVEWTVKDGVARTPAEWMGR